MFNLLEFPFFFEIVKHQFLKNIVSKCTNTKIFVFVVFKVELYC